MHCFIYIVELIKEHQIKAHKSPSGELSIVPNASFPTLDSCSRNFSNQKFIRRAWNTIWTKYEVIKVEQ